MTKRAIWKGELKIGTTGVPVKLYSAVQDRTVHFHILDERSLSRVKQHMVNPETGEEVSKDEIRKGFEVEPGTFVVLSDEELGKLEPKPSRDIDIASFVPVGTINHQWFDRPYYLGPDGNEAAYFALAAALTNKKKEGVAHWVMRNKPYVGDLRAHDGYLVLFTLRHADEVLSAAELPKPTGRALDKKELNMANQLVEILEGEFNPAEFQDEYRDRVMEFIEKKAKGRAPRLRLVKPKRQAAPLTNVLAKSIESAKKKKEKEAA